MLVTRSWRTLLEKTMTNTKTTRFPQPPDFRGVDTAVILPVANSQSLTDNVELSVFSKGEIFVS